MKKKVYLFPVIALMMSLFVACAPEQDDPVPPVPSEPSGPVVPTPMPEPDPEPEPAKTYEVVNDLQLPVSAFVDNIPADFAIFKDPMASAFAMREQALEQELGTDVEIGFRKVAYTYPSTDVKGDPITLSAVAFWLGYFEGETWNDLQPENICLMEHYTITSDAETPTNTFAVEMFVTGNSLTIMPDYIGYGVTKELPHPYLHHDICAINSIDALTGGYDLFAETGECGIAEGWKLYLAGASQGASNAIAVHKYLDTHLELAEEWNFAASNCSSGPYSPVVTIDKYLTTGKVSYPVVFPLVMKMIFEAYPEIMGEFTEEMVYSPNYLAVKAKIDEMIASKEYTTGEINEVFINEVKTIKDSYLASNEIFLIDFLNSEMLDPEAPIRKALYRCLELNDLTKDWTPVHPMKLHYSPLDEVVPMENSFAVLEAFGSDMVTLQQAIFPVDHVSTCGLWMLDVFTNGF